MTREEMIKAVDAKEGWLLPLNPTDEEVLVAYTQLFGAPPTRAQTVDEFISLTPNIPADKIATTIFHGSDRIIKTPEFGKGKRNNDYGIGFYTTKNKGLAGEWAVLWSEKTGYINEYILDRTELVTLKLDTLDIKHWIAILMDNRKGRYKEDIVYPRIEKFSKEYLIDLSPYDLITGWRADDAFFSFVEDFMLGLLSLENLHKAMKFGDLGIQTCVKSPLSFKKIKFITSYPASAQRFLQLAQDRDSKARSDYRKLPNKTRGTLIIDIIGRE